MSVDHQEASRPELSAAALGEWCGHVESILRGIAHALNNRAAALSAVLELARDPEEEPSVYAPILSTELQRVGDLVSTVRALSAAKQSVDAFTAHEAAAEATIALANHPMARERRVAFESGSAPPVRAARWMYVRALIALGANALQASAETTIQITGEGDWVVTRAKSDAGVRAGAYVREIASAMGGEPLSDGAGFRVPSLAAIRKREGREG